MDSIFPESVSWSGIQRHKPDIAEAILVEYNRVNGILPFEPGFVYMMQACGTNYFKIGKSTNPDRRLLQIAPQMPFTTRFIRVWRSNFMSLGERWAHEMWDDDRANGEWFEFSPKALKFFLLDHLGEEFALTVRHAYAYNFFVDVCAPADRRFELWIVEQTKGVLDRCRESTYPAIMQWIEQLFVEIQQNGFSIPLDLEVAPLNPYSLKKEGGAS